jgi:rSAM/selenodomain-associated transferase 1
MATARAMSEAVAIAVLAKAPIPGFAKTRLIPALGAKGAAALQERLIARAVASAVKADIGPVTLWVTPDDGHPLFRSLQKQFGVTLARQPDGDLGERMNAAVGPEPTLIIGTDCPALTADHLAVAAATLMMHDAVVIPATDGGYVLIGLRKPHGAFFTGMTWGTATVMDETRRRMKALALSWRELPALWDVDTPEDLARLQTEKLLG